MGKVYPKMTVSEYIDSIPETQKPYVEQIRKHILENLDPEFQECVNYGMLGYVVPHTKFPAGYHCDPSLPLPFAALAAQKNSINIYHMGIYSSPELMEWFKAEYAKTCSLNLDMGKSCIRFKKYDAIPFQLIGELFGKQSANDWISIYTKFHKS